MKSTHNPECPECGGCFMVPGKGPEDDVMNTPCPRCNPDPLQQILARLITEARRRKQSMHKRLSKLHGTDGIHTPSRGPLLPNGRKCFRWHLYLAAKDNHAAVTAQIARLAALQTKSKTQH